MLGILLALGLGVPAPGPAPVVGGEPAPEPAFEAVLEFSNAVVGDCTGTLIRPDPVSYTHL
ncbi:MAG: hypothetical protein KUG77_04405, partial [Nannocystaceae bacterium]|nr:hypothetical protein [Nannocystaceae bacterium]